MKYTKDSYFFETSGYDFESQVVEIMSSFAKTEWGNRAVKFSNIKQDRFEGTDVSVLGVPIDVTLDFGGKDRTSRLGALVLDGVTIEYGVRFGNSKARFTTPVLVIGADAAINITKSNMRVTLDIIKSNVLKILNKGMDEYFIATDA